MAGVGCPGPRRWSYATFARRGDRPAGRSLPKPTARSPCAVCPEPTSTREPLLAWRAMKPVASLIYDVGMNNGDDSAYYLRNCFDVVAIEAHPVLVEQARNRFAKEIDDGRLTILDV